MNLKLLAHFFLAGLLLQQPVYAKKPSGDQGWTDSVVKVVSKYQKSPKAFVESLPISKEEKNAAHKLIQKYNYTELAEVKSVDGHLELSYQGQTVIFKVIDHQQSLVSLNGYEFTWDSKKNFMEQVEFLQKVLRRTDPKAFSLLNLFFPKAEAIVCGGLCIAGLVGLSLAGGAYAACKAGIFCDNTGSDLKGKLDKTSVKWARLTCGNRGQFELQTQVENPKSIKACEYHAGKLFAASSIKFTPQSGAENRDVASGSVAITTKLHKEGNCYYDDDEFTKTQKSLKTQKFATDKIDAKLGAGYGEILTDAKKCCKKKSCVSDFNKEYGSSDALIQSGDAQAQ